MDNVLKQEWFLLGVPWCPSDLSGLVILAGSDDPHIATQLLDCDELRYLAEEENDISEEECKQVFRAVAAHIVEIHNNSLLTQPQ